MVCSLEDQVQHCRTITYAYKLLRDNQDQLFKSFEVNAANDNERRNAARIRLQAYEHNDGKVRASENVLKAFVAQLDQARAAQAAYREQRLRDEEARRAWYEHKWREERKWEARRRQEQEERSSQRHNHDEDEHDKSDEDEDDDPPPGYSQKDPQEEEQRRQRSAKAHENWQKIWEDMKAETERIVNEANKGLWKHAREAFEELRGNPDHRKDTHNAESLAEEQRLKWEHARRRRETLQEEARKAKDPLDEAFERYAREQDGTPSQQEQHQARDGSSDRNGAKYGTEFANDTDAERATTSVGTDESATAFGSTDDSAPSSKPGTNSDASDDADDSPYTPRFKPLVDAFGYPIDVCNTRRHPTKFWCTKPESSSDISSEDSSEYFDIPENETEDERTKRLRRAERRKLMLKVRFKAPGTLTEVKVYSRMDSPSKLSTSPEPAPTTGTDTSDLDPVELKPAGDASQGRSISPTDFTLRAAFVPSIKPELAESIKEGNKDWFNEVLGQQREVSLAEGELIDMEDPVVDVQASESARTAAYDLVGIL